MTASMMSTIYPGFSQVGKTGDGKPTQTARAGHEGLQGGPFPAAFQSLGLIPPAGEENCSWHPGGNLSVLAGAGHHFSLNI